MGDAVGDIDPKGDAPPARACEQCGAPAPVHWLAGRWRRQSLCTTCVVAVEQARAREEALVKINELIGAAGYPARVRQRCAALAGDGHLERLPALERLAYGRWDAPSWAHIWGDYRAPVLESVLYWHRIVLARAARAQAQDPRVRYPRARVYRENDLFTRRRPGGDAHDAHELDLLIITEVGTARASEHVEQEWRDIVSHRVDEGLPTVTCGFDPFDDVRAAHWTPDVRARMMLGMVELNETRVQEMT